MSRTAALAGMFGTVQQKYCAFGSITGVMHIVKVLPLRRLCCGLALRQAGMVKSESVRILVIENEVKLATHLSRALETEGHEARVVHDGKVALVEARDGNYDLLVLDVELPRMDGFEILKQLRSCGVTTRKEKPPPATRSMLFRWRSSGSYERMLE